MPVTRRPTPIPGKERSLPGRQQPVPVPDTHYVLGTPLKGPWPAGYQTATFGLGCFWGAEKYFWQVPGVHSTFVGYAGGHTPNPTYEEVCSGWTGHAEVACVVYDPKVVSYESLLKVFWEVHDPTQWMRQGGDVGTQYRSVILVDTEDQRQAAETSLERYQASLTKAGYGEIVTEIADTGPFYYAEPHHQQYLAKNPGGYCNHGFCQVGYSPS